MLAYKLKYCHCNWQLLHSVFCRLHFSAEIIKQTYNSSPKKKINKYKKNTPSACLSFMAIKRLCHIHFSVCVCVFFLGLFFVYLFFMYPRLFFFLSIYFNFFPVLLILVGSVHYKSFAATIFHVY